MKRIFTLLIFGALLTALSSDLMAQNALLRYADKQYELFHYQEASEVYSKAFDRKKTYRAAKGAAMSFQKINDYENSYEWWKSTLAFETSTTQDYAKFIASANQLGKMEEIREALDTLSDKNQRFDHINIDSLMNWYAHPKMVEAVPVDSVNSTAADFGGAEDKKGNFYFASDRGEAKDSGKSPIRFDVANKIEEEKYEWTGRDFLTVYKVSEEGQFSTLQSPVPDTYHFSDPYFMENKEVVFYTVTRELDKKAQKKLRKSDSVNPEMDYGQGKDQYADYHSEIFYSEINESGEFEGFNSLPFNSLLEYSVINPFLDEKNSVMYFASDMPGGFGGYDLYRVSYNEEFSFGEPENLGEMINSSGNERDPFLSGDVFYFSSDGHFGLGGLDVFSAQFNDGAFSDVQNMGVPYNSSQDDFAMMLGRDGKKYLSSNRFGGSGLDDIYLMKDMYRRFMARVINCEGELITDGFMAELREMDKMELVEMDEENQGEVMANVSPSSDFELKISKKGYFPVIDNTISTKGLEGDLLEREYTLVPIPYRTTVYADLIYYDLDKDAIREDAKPALNKLAELMKDYSFLDLMVRSHTDSRASDEYNDDLSNRRADAVARYLDNQGVAPARVKEESFGEKELTNDCGDGVPCPEREHQLNRRSELVLMAFPDENKQYELPEELEGLDFCNIRNLGIPVDVPLIHFDFDKYFLRSNDKEELERLLIMLQERPEAILSIEGHTDIRGSKKYNEALSEERAKVVRDFLIQRGIDESRIKYSWKGKSQPIHECDGGCSEEEHQLNRRTEIKLIFDQPSESKPLKGNLMSLEKKKSIEELVLAEGQASYIIAGVFSSEENVVSKVRELKDNGYAEAGFYFDQKKSLYYCYIKKLDDGNKAKEMLALLKDKFSEDIWILER